MKKLFNTLQLWLLATVIVSCSATSPSDINGELLPTQPAYADTSQWYIASRGADVDLFYIISTETGDYKQPGGNEVYHWADTRNAACRTPMMAEMKGVDELLSGTLNFYSPFYRQCTLESFVNDSIAARRMLVAVDDVKRAFTHYLNHYNHGRPFVIAGFSQGAMIVLQLLQSMPVDVYRRMVAAYVIGASISRHDLAATPLLVPAQGATDTGVTICYNSARDASCAMWPPSAVAINPVNWRTDATPATLATEPSPLIPLDQQSQDNLTVTLNQQLGLLLVQGYTGTDYVISLIGKEGNYHSREIWLYRHSLRENIDLRSRLFLEKNK